MVKQIFEDNALIYNNTDAASKCGLIDKIIRLDYCNNDFGTESDSICLAVFGNQYPSRALASKQYERFARQLYSFRNHEQTYDILYFKTGSKSDSLIMNDIAKGELLYGK